MFSRRQNSIVVWGRQTGLSARKEYQREGCVTDKTPTETLVPGSENMQSSLFSDIMYGLTFCSFHYFSV